MQRKRLTTAVVPVLTGVAAVVFAASPAGAHTGGPVHGLADGALHPLTGVDHLLAMLAVGVVAAAVLVHGNAHGAEAPSAANPLLYALGFLAVTAALHAVGAFGGVAIRRAPALRVAAGAGVAAVGVLLLG